MPRVEHHHARQHHRREGQESRDDREAGELKPQAAEPAQSDSRGEPGRERGESDDEREEDHAAKR